MNPSDQKFRFDELCAGCAMGDLSSEEERELVRLSGQLGIKSDLAFELMVASIEVDFFQHAGESLPAALSQRLHRTADEVSVQRTQTCLQVSAWQKIISNPLTGWAVAASIGVIALVGSHSPRVSPTQAEANLRSEARDLIERSFAGLGAFKGAGGKVIWSDQRQEGYMTLNGVPVNDPNKEQYQLWIVDPKRDEAPVDGGVFNILTDSSPVVVPIVAKLVLTNPQAFVITLEQPGGVVKSKQEQVIALARN